MIAFLKGLFEKEWNKEEKVLVVCTVGLLGILTGFLLAPVKGDWKIFSENGCNSGNNNGRSHEEEEAE